MSDELAIKKQAFFAAAKRGSVPDIHTYSADIKVNEHDELGNTGT